MNLRILLYLLAILTVLPSLAVTEESKVKAFFKPDVFFLNWATVDITDDYLVYGALQFNHDYKISEYFAYEYRVSPLRYIKFRDTDQNYFVSTPVVMFGLFCSIVYPSLLIPGNDGFGYLIPLFTLFGSHIAYRPYRGFHVFAGMIPDFILFTEDNGLLLQFQAGIRAYVVLGLKVNLKIIHYKPIGFDQYTKSSTGLGVEIGYNFYDFSYRK